MENRDKIILDLCGGTGAWSRPYEKAGYDVRNITLPDYDIRNYIVSSCENIYGILAAPPCTMFSLARTRAKTPRDFREGMELVQECLKIIWECRYNYKLKFWCLENPMGYLRQFLGKPVFTFNPCDFGDNYTKKTDLWGYFNIPKKNPIILTEKEIALCKVNNRKLPSTPPGFAQAFFEANQ